MLFLDGCDDVVIACGSGSVGEEKQIKVFLLARKNSYLCIIKTVEEGKRLKYVYTAVPVQEAWNKVKGKIQEILDEITRVREIKAVLF